MITLEKYGNKYSIKSTELVYSERGLSDIQVEDILTELGVPAEEVIIAVGLLEADDEMDYVTFDAHHRAVINDEYGEIS